MMDLILYKNFPINDYENQVYYSNASDRNNAFDNYKDIEIKNLSSCDKTKQTIRLNINYYVGNQYNYGCIIEHTKNKSGANVTKRYYIFVDVVQWLSNNTVILHYQYDYWQTYCYNITFKKSFIEREHVSNDTFGSHMIDENLPISDYLIKGNKNVDYKSSDIVFCVALSDNSYVWDTPDFSRNTPLFWTYGTGLQELTVGFTEPKDAFDTIDYYVSQNKIDTIQGFYYAPVPSNKRQPVTIGKENEVISTTAFVVLPNDDYETETMTRLSSFGSYVPKNNKCFCYPYNFVNITNYIGSTVRGQYELSNNKNQITLRYNFPTTEGASPNCYLYNYNGLTHAIDNSMSSFVNPELPYVTNQYSAYLSANTNTLNNTRSYVDSDYNFQKNQAFQSAMYNTISSGTSAIGSASVGNVGGAIGGVEGGINQLFNFAQKKDTLDYNRVKAIDSINASLNDQASKGDISHGAFIPNILTNIGRCGFQMQQLQVTEECIKMVDDYFNMFGYKVNRIGDINIHKRAYWDYMKTSGINIVGNIPQDALTTIKNMFNQGVTIWHDVTYMYDYSRSNNIL